MLTLTKERTSSEDSYGYSPRFRAYISADAYTRIGQLFTSRAMIQDLRYVRTMASSKNHITLYAAPGFFRSIYYRVLDHISSFLHSHNEAPPSQSYFDITYRQTAMHYPKAPRNPTTNGVLKPSYTSAWKSAPAVTKANMHDLKLSQGLIAANKFPPALMCSHLRGGAIKCTSGECYFLGIEDEDKAVRVLEGRWNTGFSGADPKPRRWVREQKEVVEERRMFVNEDETRWVACVEDL